MKNLFLVVNNNSYTINNNYGASKWIHKVKMILKNMTGVFKDDIFTQKMLNTFDGDIDVADAIVYVYADVLIYTNDEWFYFDSKWKKINSITNDIIRSFVSFYNKINEYIDNLEGMLEVEKYEYKHQVNQLKNDIVNEKKNKTIIEELKSRCKNTGTDLFDSNKNLFAFNDGVYDFEKNTFRKIVPSDMITKTCGYNYSNKYVNKQMLLSVLSNMFESKELLDGFLLYLALSLCYKNDTIYAFMIKWTKNNLFRLMVSLIELVFGDYCCKMNKKNFFSTKIVTQSDETYLKTLRMVIVESVKYFSKNELNDLVIKNVRSVNTVHPTKNAKLIDD